MQNPRERMEVKNDMTPPESPKGTIFISDDDEDFCCDPRNSSDQNEDVEVEKITTEDEYEILTGKENKWKISFVSKSKAIQNPRERMEVKNDMTPPESPKGTIFISDDDSEEDFCCDPRNLSPENEDVDIEKSSTEDESQMLGEENKGHQTLVSTRNAMQNPRKRMEVEMDMMPPECPETTVFISDNDSDEDFCCNPRNSLVENEDVDVEKITTEDDNKGQLTYAMVPTSTGTKIKIFLVDVTVESVSDEEMDIDVEK